MARLKFSTVTENYQSYKEYKPWLEANSYPNFCGYSWLIDQTALTIDHYKPIEHYPELETNPDNLILCTFVCNSSKKDYHPEAKNRTIYKSDKHYIFNYRNEDIGKYMKLKRDGSLQHKKHKTRYIFNEKVFKYNLPHFKKVRKKYLDSLNLFIRIYNRFYIAKKKNDSEFINSLEECFTYMKNECSRQLIFYKLLNIKIPKQIEKLLSNQTQAIFS